MSDIDDLMSQLPIADIAARLGVSEAEATHAAAAALPTLMKGLQANAHDPDGAASLLNALQAKDPRVAESPISLADVDADDGAAIVANIFGGATDQVPDRLGASAIPGGSDLFKKLLPILAPIVLSFIAKKLGGGAGSSGGSGGGLQDILGGVLGGGSGGSGASGGGLEDLIGGMLGGNSGGSGGSGGGLESILGSVLGGVGDGTSGSGGGLDELLGGLLGGGKR